MQAQQTYEAHLRVTNRWLSDLETSQQARQELSAQLGRECEARRREQGEREVLIQRISALEAERSRLLGEMAEFERLAQSRGKEVEALRKEIPVREKEAVRAYRRGRFRRDAEDFSSWRTDNVLRNVYVEMKEHMSSRKVDIDLHQIPSFRELLFLETEPSPSRSQLTAKGSPGLPSEDSESELEVGNGEE